MDTKAKLTELQRAMEDLYEKVEKLRLEVEGLKVSNTNLFDAVRRRVK